MDSFTDSFLLPAVAAAPLSGTDPFAIQASLDRALRTHPSGIVAQFGVYRGHTLKTLSNICNASCHIFAFDSFQGLPEKWRSGKTATFERKFTAKGAFGLNGHVPKLGLNNVAYTVGLFADTLPSFLKTMLHQTAAFLHIDGDLYASARDVLCAFEDRGMLKGGTVIVFDELLGFPEFRSGEVRALYQCLVARGHRIRILERGIKKVLSNYSREVWPQSVAIQLLS